MNREQAEAICVIVAAGYLVEDMRRRMVVEEGQYVPWTFPSFEYETSDDVDEHVAIQEVLAQCGIHVEINQTPPREAMPCIIAKSERCPDRETAQMYLENFIPFLVDIQERAIAKGENAPRGAYIGVKFMDDHAYIVGPSSLFLYRPAYRDVDMDVDANYCLAAVNSAVARECVAESVASENGRGIALALGPFEALENYTPGRLYGSIHGMTAVICEYPDDHDGIYAEIAMGPNTSKTASCLPCAIFMSANDQPASAVHFGRGDSWNLPQKLKNKGDAALKIRRWEQAVRRLYLTGRDHLLGYPLPRVQNAIDYVENIENWQERMPQIFLEALTFESPFARKIGNTLGQ